MPIKKIFPHLILLSLLVSSCVVNDKSLGSQFLPDEYKLSIDSARFDLPLTIQYPDSIQGYSNSHLIVGSICDPVFGAMSSGSASMIYPLSDSTYFGVEPEIISTYLNLRIDSTVIYKADQEGIPQNLYVYKMINDLDSTKLFNTSITAADYDPTPISLGHPVFFGDDSIRIYLSEEFGKELLSTTIEEFDSTELFLKKIKGLYITTDAPDVVAEGGRLNYLSLQSSYLYLRYYLTDAQRNKYRVDTLETFYFGYGFAVNTIKTSSKALATDTPGDELYIESMSGVKPHIKGSEIKSMLDEWMTKNGYTKETVLISRASLEFPFEMDVEDYDIVDKQYPQEMFPCYIESSSDSLKFFTPLTEIYATSMIGNINRSLKRYICDITMYLQDLIRMDNEKITSTQDLFISPVYSFVDSSNNTYYAFDNLHYNKAVINGPTSERKPTLTITYAILTLNN